MDKKKTQKISTIIGSIFLGGFSAFAGSRVPLEVGQNAPPFTAKTHEGAEFDLATRKGHWTVLYFYPKSDTPGCTKQACAFRDNIDKIRNQRANVFGVSVNSVKDQKKFHEKYHLNFTLLADPEAAIVRLYGTKTPLISMSKRWTFIIDPELKIRAIEKDVDPALDADKVAELIANLRKS